MATFLKLVLMLLFAVCLTRANAQGSPQITRVETLNPQNLQVIFSDSLQRRNVTQGLETVTTFVKKRVESGVDTTTGIAAELSNYIFKQISGESLLFEIIAVNNLTHRGATFVLNSYLVFPNVPDRIFRGSFDLAVDFQQSKVIFPNYDTRYETTSYKNINFVVKKTDRHDLLPTLKSGEKFNLINAAEN